MAHFCDAAHAFNKSLQISQHEQAPLIRGNPIIQDSMTRAITYIRVILASGFAGETGPQD
jgi:hypothetical protein